MATHLHAPWHESDATEHPDSSQTDEFLINQARSGSLAHFEILYRRHKPAADRLARLLTETSEADDLVAEGFSQTLTQLLAGNGPDVSFRAYLLTTVRNAHFRAHQGHQRTAPTDDLEQLDQPVQDEDMVLRSHEDNSIRRAFESLPENWQLVLWHLEVERERPAQVADRLALSPNGVSALALRAREGLRQAYLRQHTEEASSAACRRTLDQLPSYVRAKRRRRKHAAVAEHLADCASCHAAYLELSEMNGRLGVVLAPALLGAVGWQYLSSTPSAGLAFLAHPWEWFQHHFVASASHSAPLAAKIGISAVVAVTVVTVVAVSQALEDPGTGTQASVSDPVILDPSPTASPSRDRPASPSESQSAAATEERSAPAEPDRPSPEAPAPAAETPQLSAPTAPVPAPRVDTPAPAPTASVAPTAPLPTTEPTPSTEPTAPAEPTPSVEPLPTTPATETPPSEPTPSPAPDPEPTEPEESEPPTAPQATALSVGHVAVEREVRGWWHVSFTPAAKASSDSGVIDLTTTLQLDSAAVLMATEGWSCAAPNPLGLVLENQAVTCSLAWDVSSPPLPVSITVISATSPTGSITISSDHVTSDTVAFDGS